MSRYIKKHRRKFAGVAVPLFLLFVVVAIGLNVYPGWVKPTFGVIGAPCENFGNTQTDPLLSACDRCAGEICSLGSAGSVCTLGGTLTCPSCQCINEVVMLGTSGGTFVPDTQCGAPSNAYCQDRSGGTTLNDCRIGVCTTNTTVNLGFPSGCDYDYDVSNIDCINCAPPSPASVNCGNGVCEEGIGESFSTCPVDCRAPGFTGSSVLSPTDPILNAACPNISSISFIEFSGNLPNGNSCEDGDICTENTCNPNGGCDVIDPADCSGNTADFCCPSGCNPAPSGTGTCNTSLDPDCDIDCLPPEDCIPSPSPIPTFPPGLLPLIEGSGIFCSLNEDAAPLASNLDGWVLLAVSALGAGYLVSRRKKA